MKNMSVLLFSIAILAVTSTLLLPYQAITEEGEEEVTQQVAIFCRGVAATMVATSGDDVIEGTAGPDVIHGLRGNDRIIGDRGNDHICGGGGHDDLFGEELDDTLRGGRGFDTIDGGTGNDTCTGEVLSNCP